MKIKFRNGLGAKRWAEHVVQDQSTTVIWPAILSVFIRLCIRSFAAIFAIPPAELWHLVETGRMVS